jgi:hypothetical protein
VLVLVLVAGLGAAVPEVEGDEDVTVRAVALRAADLAAWV